jgi:hypothetical protein
MNLNLRPAQETEQNAPNMNIVEFLTTLTTTRVRFFSSQFEWNVVGDQSSLVARQHIPQVPSRGSHPSSIFVRLRDSGDKICDFQKGSKGIVYQRNKL